MPTAPRFFFPKQLFINPPTLANKTCPPNSRLINNMCEYTQIINRPSRLGRPRQCPDNYQQLGSFSCKVINPKTQPLLMCDNGYVLQEDGTCVQECPGKFIGAACMTCDRGKLEAGMCLSCPDNKELKNGMCW